MTDFDGAMLAPVSPDVAQLPMSPPPPTDEASTLFLAGAIPPDGDAVLLADTAGEGDEWFAFGLSTSSSDGLAITLADPGDLGMLTPLSNEGDEEQEIVITGDRWPEDDWTGGGGSWTGGSGGGESGGTGGGNGDGAVSAGDHEQDCGTDDGAAVQVANHVTGALPPSVAGPPNPMQSAGGSDWTEVEFGAVIVQNADGTFGALNDTIYSSDQQGGRTAQ